MPRRAKTKTLSRDWRWYASMLLNGLIAVSMVLGTVFLFTGAPTPQAAAPTIDIPTLAPTVSASPTIGVIITATPAAHATPLATPSAATATPAR